ncbi:MAG: LytR C-terminal domain-containing protein [Acidimicrobiales bacterium]
MEYEPRVQATEGGTLVSRRMGAGRNQPEAGASSAAGLVLVAVLLIVGILVLSKSGGATHATATATAATKPKKTASTTTLPAPTTTTTTVPPSQVKLQVLNGVLVGELATQWSAKLKAGYGYLTEPPDNATSKVATSIIYVLTPGYVPEADVLAQEIGLTSAAVDTTVPPPASAPIPATERSTANLVLVIGPNLVAGA